MTERIVVTGGSGFIGTNLVERHRDAGDDVVNLDHEPPRNPAHAHLWREVDLLDPDRLRDLVHGHAPDVVYHLGARTDLHGTDVSEYAANVDGVRHMIDCAAELPPTTRVVFASSRMVCRIDHRPTREDEYSPPNAYGESKRLGELMVRGADLACTWTMVRPTSIWGPWFAIPYRTFFETVQRGRYVHPRGRSIPKSFGYVANTVHELERIVSAPPELVRGRTFYLGDYPPIEVATMAQKIADESRVRSVRHVPVPALRGAALLGDALKFAGWREPPLTSFRLDNLMTTMVYDLAELEAVVGPLPYTMEEGIRETVAWMADHP